MRDLGFRYFLHIKVKKIEHGTIIYQTRYKTYILRSFQKKKNKPYPPKIAMGLTLSKKYSSKNVDPTT